MGFFGSLWNGFKEGAKTALAVAVSPLLLVGYGVKKAYDKVKEVLSGDSKQVEQRTANVSRDVGQTDSYEDYHTTTQVRDLQAILNEYLEIYRDEGKKAEQVCKDYVNECFDAIIEKLRENDELAKSYGMDTLIRQKDRLCRDIDGAIVKAIREHLSTDDYDCRKILNMPRGSEKGRRMREFVLQTIDDAKADLADRVSQTMHQINDDLTNFLNDYLETCERDANRKKNIFEQWERDMNTNNFDAERAQLPVRNKLYAIEQIEKIIAA